MRSGLPACPLRGACHPACALRYILTIFRPHAVLHSLFFTFCVPGPRCIYRVPEQLAEGIPAPGIYHAGGYGSPAGSSGF